MPINKFKGDEIYNGTINLHGSIIMKTTQKSKDSSIQKLIKLVNSSSPENAEIVKSADKWAVWIIIIAFSASILTYIFTGKIIQSVTILVIFCPCALVLVTPTAIMATIGNLTKHGILVKEGQSIEELAHTNELIFDKTGTLTYGKPKVVKIRSKDENMMYLLASLESKSEHSIAKAIMDYYGDKNLEKVENFKMIIGKGIKGIINGDEVTVGNKKLLKDEKIKLKNTSKLKKGESNVFLVKNREVIGEIILADVLREEAKSTVEKLKLLEIKTTLMTGDNEQIGRYIANKLKITNLKYNCLPEDKIKYIKEEQLKNNRITMIGDGINDAPSLKKANVGIAMGKIGSDISIEAANITLIKDNIGDLPHLISISRKTLRTININIAFSLLLNITAMFLAVLGILNPITGALIHNIGSVIVIIYSILLLKYELSSKDYKKLGMTKNLNRIN